MKFAKIIFLQLLIAFVFTTTLLAQGGGKTYDFSGKVTDAKGEVLPYVAVAIYKTADSTYVKGVATDMDGKFKIPLPNGNYYAKLSFLSFESKIIPNIEIANKAVEMKKIVMKSSSLALDEFEVVEEKKLMEMDLDKRVFNVDKDITNQGADATEVLNSVPSVDVDIDGNVSLRGSGNVRILINGKPSGMTGMSTSQALKQLQGNQIEKIEVITNPSSRYDAEGEVGIINIILKKDKREGINGSVNVDVGYPSNYGGGFNLNIKKEKINYFFGYGVNYRESPGTSISTQRFFYPDTSFSYESVSKNERNTINHNFRAGTSYDINEHNSVTLSGSFNAGDADNSVELQYSDYNSLDIPVQVVNRDEVEDKDLSSYDVSFNYRKTFKQKNRLFTIDAQKSGAMDFEDSFIYQKSTDASQNSVQSVFNNEKSDDWLFQADYVHPYKEGKFETGLKSTLRTLTNPYGVGTFNDASQQFEALPGFYNDMEYNENIYAAYMMFGNKVKKKFSYQLGVRAEYSDVTTLLKLTDEENNRQYFNLFPSVHFSYELKKETSVQLSYSKRIQRPRHWYLLPFFSFSDARNVFTGNPNLNPEFSDSYEAGYLKMWKKGSLLSSVYYRYTTDVITRIIVPDDEGNTIRLPYNLGTRDAYGVEFSGSYDPFKVWSVRGSFNFFREIQEGELNNQRYDADTYTWSTRLNSKWTIKKKVNLQASAFYRAPRQEVQGSDKAMYSLDAGFSFDLLKGKGTITFNVNDIFNTRKWRGTAEGDNFISVNERQWRTRWARLSFSYRINQQKKRQENYQRDFNGDFEGG
ncbi:MAG: hypothetical protein VR77_07040 [Flavobacteriales bacterium BRH_c54]|nr:MAG: hypothetical protein VR77_07040 [Flavobacteriales bacterium BRH_c54]